MWEFNITNEIYVINNLKDSDRINSMNTKEATQNNKYKS
jgi:hypothetical protein